LEKFSLLPHSDAFRKQRKNILQDLFSLVLSQFKKYHYSGNLKFYYLGIFQNLKLRTLMEKVPSISLERNLTSNTLGLLWFFFHKNTKF